MKTNKTGRIIFKIILSLYIVFIFSACDAQEKDKFSLIVEVSIIEILQNLGKPKDSDFKKAIEKTMETQKDSEAYLEDIFFNTFKEIAPNRNLNEVFTKVGTMDKVNFKTLDADVIQYIKSNIEEALEITFRKIKKRITVKEIKNPSIQKISNKRQILIKLSNKKEMKHLRHLISTQVKLEFWEVWKLQDVYPHLFAFLYVLQPELNSSTLKSNDTTKIPEPLLKPLQYRGFVAKVADTASINKVIRSEEGRVALSSQIQLLWDVKPLKDKEEIILYPLKGSKASLTGDIITKAEQVFDYDSRPAVSMQMNEEGTKKWRELTAKSIGKRIAIILDNTVYSDPTVMSEIPNGSCSIAGNFTKEEARKIADLLEFGALPVSVHIIENK